MSMYYCGTKDATNFHKPEEKIQKTLLISSIMMVKSKQNLRFITVPETLKITMDINIDTS